MAGEKIGGAPLRLSRSVFALMVAAMGVALGGCPPEKPPVDAPPYIDEGYTDYRRGDLNSASQAGGTSGILRKFAPQGSDAESHGLLVNYGDVFYVSLLQAYINDFFDTPILPPQTKRPESQLDDAAVIVNVAESETGGYVSYPPVPCGSGPCNNFTPDGCARPSAGLWAMFYSSDVHSNQFLNFSNEPVYGPAKYCGRPLRIEIMIVRLELLADNPVLQDEIRRLIAYVQGKSLATLTPQEIQTVSTETPESLVRQLKSRRVGMLYSLVLMPPGGMNQLPYPRIEVGNYVLVRSNTRSEDAPNWENLMIDNNTGRLMLLSAVRVALGQKSDATPLPMQTGPMPLTSYYRDRSYVTLQINSLPTTKGTPPAQTSPAKPPKSRKRNHA